MSGVALQQLARDQWVRIHGTPRITVLVGGRGAALWRDWLAVASMTGELFVVEDDRDFDRAARAAYDIATRTPETPVAIVATRDAIARWRAGRTDRLAALIAEGLPTQEEGRTDSPSDEILDAVRAFAAPPALTTPEEPALGARSAAEAAMFEALEATPTTAGRFALNEHLSVRFGDSAAQVDLLSRRDRIAIEIDGYHHFTDVTAYRRDRRKDVLLQTQGLFVLRFLAEDVVRDPRDAVNAVIRAIAFRAGEKT